jgi:hypothetical protein
VPVEKPETLEGESGDVGVVGKDVFEERRLLPAPWAERSDPKFVNDRCNEDAAFGRGQLALGFSVCNIIRNTGS